MPLTDEQTNAVKEQILKQVENLPEDKREQIREYISSMNNEQIEEFLRKNKQMQEESGEDEEANQKCIMCSIASKKIESQVIYEDEEYLAVLELNPLSKGHTILIPKKHVENPKELPKSTKKITEKIGNQIVKKLKAESFQSNLSGELGHIIINIIPVYKDEKIDKRKPAKKEELISLKKEIGEIKSAKKKAEKKEKPKEELKQLVKEIIKLPRRVP